jgi:hypothetical protein
MEGIIAPWMNWNWKLHADLALWTTPTSIKHDKYKKGLVS